MDSKQYQAICTRPDVMSRDVLESSARGIPSPLNLQLLKILDGDAVSKPALHTGGEGTDYFYVDISLAEAEEIVSELLSAEADAVNPTGHTSPKASCTASLVDQWINYVEFREQTAFNR